EDAALDVQRYAEERLDSLLAQDRIEDVRVVDVLEDDRQAFGRDASCESAADGDAHSLLDLLLDAYGSACDQLVRALVEQEDGARVDGEDLADALEQRPEQPVEVEVRECRIRDRLQVVEPRAAVSRHRPALNPASGTASPLAARPPAHAHANGGGVPRRDFWPQTGKLKRRAACTRARGRSRAAAVESGRARSSA